MANFPLLVQDAISKLLNHLGNGKRTAHREENRKTSNHLGDGKL